MNAVKTLLRCRQVTRKFNTSAVCRRDLAEFKELQRQMQVDDGVPVYLKKGSSDRLIFALVVSYLGILLAYSGVTLKRIIFPPPNS